MQDHRECPEALGNYFVFPDIAHWCDSWKIWAWPCFQASILWPSDAVQGKFKVIYMLPACFIDLL